MSDLLKFITCGSVDDGKSTLIGHILYDSKLLYADQEKALLLDSKVGSTGGDIDYSLLLDGLMAEREQGITIDVAYRYFTTDKRSFIVADTPGHEEYTRNMAVGASFADLAVILIDATQGVLVQTRRHARICALMGIHYFVFAVNKMDLANYSKERFDEITEQIHVLANELHLRNVQIIPVSATKGDNITKKSANMPWYEGPAILEYLENVDVTERGHEEGCYMPVQRVNRPDHTFRGFQGQIEAGTVRIGDELTVLPSGEKAEVEHILIGDKDAESADEGRPVTICLNREIDISRGCVLEKDSKIAVSKVFDATLLWMDDARLADGEDFFVKLGTKKIGGFIRRILYKTDINSGEQVKADTLEKNEIALCEIVLDEAIPMDLFRNHKTMGELILIDRISNMTAACGVVEKLVNEEDTGVRISGGDITARVNVFDEFFFNEKHDAIENMGVEEKEYEVGDSFPVKGESYEYPNYFDILSVDSGAYVQIRDDRVAEVGPIENYRYTGLPAVNANGFAVGISSQKDFENFLKDRKSMDRQEFNAKWLTFETYRRIIFTGNSWSI
ncbi:MULTISPECIES: sulfate adenylyltransferase subunit 1 [unclassified Bilifractor]|uniref:sulfate adenylyltransferase subunit 1 n=1 Tax=unclassified Bilifractor TaxID=2815795 RepID=UPI003F91E51A